MSTSTKTFSAVPPPAPIPTAPKIWTTLITNLAYLPGLLLLDQSLKAHNTAFPFLALYTSSLPQSGLDALDRRGIPRKEIKKLSPKKERDFSADPRFYEVWSKLEPFSMVEYERVVLLDSDMLVVKNMDELMEVELDPVSMEGKGERVLASTHACVCNPLGREHYPKDWTPLNCGFTTQHSTPDIAQTQGGPNTDSQGVMNTGIMVLNPSRAIYDQILHTLTLSSSTENYTFGDQSLMSDIFRNRWVVLPYIYNALKTMRKENVHGKIWRDENVKNVHYILSPKPWDEKAEDAEEIHGWWHVANKERVEEERQRGIVDEFQ